MGSMAGRLESTILWGRSWNGAVFESEDDEKIGKWPALGAPLGYDTSARHSYLI